MRVSATLAAGALAMGVSAKNYLGFNSGATLPDRSAKFKADFKSEFETAQNLKNSPGDFNAVRLYTNIQAYSENDPIEAFEAAIETDTSILLGVWASGTDNIDNEISALKKAISKYGTELTDLIIGVSIGSEDLYRNSATGVKNEAGVGTDPDVLVGFITDFRKAFKDSSISDIPVGHVDTWDVWPNSTNSAVIDAVDFIGVDEYPYYENDKGNSIENAGTLFDKAYDATVAAVKGKPVWVTETGWPYTGPTWDEAVASVKNAQRYWRDIGCRRLFNQVPTFWYTLRDSNPDNEMKFAITKDLSTNPLFDLSCEGYEELESSTSSSTKQSTKTSTTSKATETSDDDEDSTTVVSASASATATKGSSSDDSNATTVATATGAAATSTSGSETGSSSGSGSGSSSGSDDSESGSDSTESGSGTEGSGSGDATESDSESAETPSTVVSGASGLKISAAALALLAALAL